MAKCYTPEILNPYPKGKWSAITRFEYGTHLQIVRFKDAVPNRRGKADADYVVREKYSVSYELDGARHVVTVPKGMLTDLASVPRFELWPNLGDGQDQAAA